MHSNGKRMWLALGLLFLTVIFSYRNSFNNGFMFDDYDLILENPRLKAAFDLKEFFRDPVRTHEVHYRPLSSIVRWGLYHVFGEDPRGYHAFNAGLLVVYAFLLFIFLRRLIQDEQVAFLTAGLFVVHPIQGMVVNYITAHEVTFFGISMLGGLLFWMLFVDTQKGMFYGFSFLCFLMGLLFQELAALLPVFLFITTVYFRKTGRLLLKLFPFFLAAGGYLFWRWSVSAHYFEATPIPVVNYTATIFELGVWYIAKLFWPQDILWIRNFPVALGAMAVTYFVLTFFLLLACGVCLWRTYQKTIGWALAIFLAGFLPLGVLPRVMPHSGLIIEPHWFFFSSMGFFSAVAIGWRCLPSFMSFRWKIFVAVILLGILSGQTTQMNRHWRSEKDYARYWLNLAEQYHLPHFGLARAYLKEGELDLAERHFRKSLVGDFMDWQVYVNLSLVAQRRGDFAMAEIHLQQALKFYPQGALAYNNLGVIFSEQNRLAEAKEVLLKAITCDPRLPEPRLNLAYVFLQEGRFQAAEDLCLENLQMSPEDWRSELALLTVYWSRQKKEAAFVLAEKILLRRLNADAATDFGSFFAVRQAQRTAFQFYQKALRAEPRNKHAHIELGKLYGNSGQLPQAMDIWRQGLALYPDEDIFRQLIRQAQELIPAVQNLNAVPE